MVESIIILIVKQAIKYSLSYGRINTIYEVLQIVSDVSICSSYIPI